MNLKIIGMKQKKEILLFIKTFKLNLDKVEVQYSTNLMKNFIVAIQ
jgi:hypothetical protein